MSDWIELSEGGFFNLSSLSAANTDRVFFLDGKPEGNEWKSEATRDEVLAALKSRCHVVFAR